MSNSKQFAKPMIEVGLLIFFFTGNKYSSEATLCTHQMFMLIKTKRNATLSR
jgi:hypothetical protein